MAKPERKRIFPSFPWLSRSLSLTVLLLLVCLSGRGAPQHPQAEDDTALRNRAFELLDRNNFIEALPLLEKLAAAHPSDATILERLAVALTGKAASLKDGEERKQLRLRARSLLLRAQELGYNSSLLYLLLEQLPADGVVTPFSSCNEADEEMRKGEAAFARSDFAAALAAYQHALELDPKLYEAALFTGDVYFKMNQMDKAGEWFARAIQIEPRRETAYRYWGDALAKDGEMDEARDRYIEAVIAQPYIRASRIGLSQWAELNQATLSHPKTGPPGGVKVEGNAVTLAVDPATFKKKDGNQHWMTYQATRAAWAIAIFAKELPNEKAYRHTLREEVQALTEVADLVSKDVKKRKIKSLDPSLATLLKLREEDLLEAYVLLSRADEGIAKDYAAYRAAHRDKLRRYICNYIISTEKTKN